MRKYFRSVSRTPSRIPSVCTTQRQMHKVTNCRLQKCPCLSTPRTVHASCSVGICRTTVLQHDWGSDAPMGDSLVQFWTPAPTA